MFGKRRRDDDRDDGWRPDDVRDYDHQGEGYVNDPREGGRHQGDSRRDDGRGGGPWGVPGDQVDLWHANNGHGGHYQGNNGQGRYQGSAAEGPGDQLRPGPRAAPGVPQWGPTGDPAYGDARGRAARDYPDVGYGGAGYGGASYGGASYGDAGYGGGAGHEGAGYGGASYGGAGYDGGAGYGRADYYPQGGHDPGLRNDAGRNGIARNGSARDGGWHEDDAYRGSAFNGAPRNGEYGMVPTFQPRAPEFRPPAEGASGAHLPAVDHRPYGRLSIFTLINEKEAEFDRLASRAAEGVRASEPGTLAYVIHAVPQVPAQRIIYEIYRDRAAFERHERQPHIREFAEARKALMLAVNIIDLRPDQATMVLPGAASRSAREEAPGYVAHNRRAPDPAGRPDGDGGYANGGNNRPGAAAGPGYPGAANRWDDRPANGQYRKAVNGRHASRGWSDEDWGEPRGPGQRDGSNLHGAPHHPA